MKNDLFSSAIFGFPIEQPLAFIFIQSMPLWSLAITCGAFNASHLIWILIKGTFLSIFDSQNDIYWIVVGIYEL